MPLRAVVDGEDIIAPLLDDIEWSGLRAAAKAKTKRLVLPCCGLQARMRVSKRGLKHFYHPADSGCTSAGETLEHLMAKLVILQACKRAGYTPRTEWAENDWRADVLAVKGKTRLAFEVQWSPQTLEETYERQARYARDDVRGCWFFREPPDDMAQGWQRPVRNLQAWESLPLFVLERSDDGAYTTYLHEREFELGAFVEALLNRQIAFRPSYASIQDEILDVGLFPMKCWKCQKYSHVYTIESRPAVSPCGVKINGAVVHEEHILRPEVMRAVREFCRTERTPQGWPLRVGVVEQHYRDDIKAHFPAFSCTRCHTFLAREHRRRRQHWGEWDASFEMRLPRDRPISRVGAHWCYSPDGQFCSILPDL